jgi:hypothetical protein
MLCITAPVLNSTLFWNAFQSCIVFTCTTVNASPIITSDMQVFIAYFQVMCMGVVYDNVNVTFYTLEVRNDHTSAWWTGRLYSDGQLVIVNRSFALKVGAMTIHVEVNTYNEKNVCPRKTTRSGWGMTSMHIYCGCRHSCRSRQRTRYAHGLCMLYTWK